MTTGRALTAEVAQLLSGDINASLAATLTNALNAGEARAKVPDLLGLDVVLQDAAFAADGNNLLVLAHGSARMGRTAFNTLLDFLIK